MFGFLGTVTSVILLSYFLWEYRVKKEWAIKWWIIGIVGIILLFIIERLIWPHTTTESWVVAILLAPVAEEILYRRILLENWIRKLEKEESGIKFWGIALILSGVIVAPIQILTGDGKNIFLFLIMLFLAIYLFKNIPREGIRDKIVLFTAIVGQAVIFTSVHQLSMSWSIFILGIFCGLIYYKTRNVYLTIAIHIIYNLITVSF